MFGLCSRDHGWTVALAQLFRGIHSLLGLRERQPRDRHLCGKSQEMKITDRSTTEEVLGKVEVGAIFSTHTGRTFAL